MFQRQFCGKSPALRVAAGKQLQVKSPLPTLLRFSPPSTSRTNGTPNKFPLNHLQHIIPLQHHLRQLPVNLPRCNVGDLIFAVTSFAHTKKSRSARAAPATQAAADRSPPHSPNHNPPPPTGNKS